MADRFRKAFRSLDDHEKAALDDIKSKAEILARSIEDGAPESRERSLAITKLEESVMWAVKGITA